jgi:hypothetical protein
MPGTAKKMGREKQLQLRCRESTAGMFTGLPAEAGGTPCIA